MIETNFTKLINVKYPIIMAPMFLVSNTKMIIAALNSGITAAIPALNFRTEDKLINAINEIKDATDKPFGINLIVNKSNIKYKKQLEICLDTKVDFIITSLGNPKETINKCHEKGIKVFCDVIDLKFAQKVEKLGADAIIAVNKNAGGHPGYMEQNNLIPLLKEHCNIPIISSGGIAKGNHLKEAINLGADAVNIGTLFIASNEANVSSEYKNALIQYGAKDIVRTSKISGTPLTVINTPYIQQMGTKPNFLEKLMHRSKRLKKYAKLLIAAKGMKLVENAAFGVTYKTAWCAGPGIEYINSIRPVKEIIETLINEYEVNN